MAVTDVADAAHVVPDGARPGHPPLLPMQPAVQHGAGMGDGAAAAHVAAHGDVAGQGAAIGPGAGAAS